MYVFLKPFVAARLSEFMLILADVTGRAKPSAANRLAVSLQRHSHWHCLVHGQSTFARRKQKRQLAASNKTQAQLDLEVEQFPLGSTCNCRPCR